MWKKHNHEMLSKFFLQEAFCNKKFRGHFLKEPNMYCFVVWIPTKNVM